MYDKCMATRPPRAPPPARRRQVLCYWAQLLTRYGALLAYAPEAGPNATEYANVAVMVA